jgi:Trp operon repressor
MEMGIFRESGWKAEVEILEDKSNDKEERYLLKVMKTIRESNYFGSRSDGEVFEVMASRKYRYFVDWHLEKIKIKGV